MAGTTRVGRYDNPYAVAEWSRPPPAGTGCEPLILETPDRAIANGSLYARGGETTAVLLVHPRANFSHHYAVPGLVDQFLREDRPPRRVLQVPAEVPESDP